MILLKKYRSGFMPKSILLLCLLMFIASSNTLFAQREYDNDISMGYGLVTSNQIFDVTADVLTSVILPGNLFYL